MYISKREALFFAVIFFSCLILQAQKYYVDPINGSDSNTGTIEAPLKTLDNTFERINKLTGKGDINVILLPGNYVLTDKIAIHPIRLMREGHTLTIQANTMPDDDEWSIEKMPIIQSVSPNNSTTLFNHSVGFLVASENVIFKGLKFLGNPNPTVNYYYPIAKEDAQLGKLEVHQCMFIGDKEASKIQGGIWANGPKTIVDHSVFYECRNAILLFENVGDFRVSNSIITKSYESVFWLGPEDMKFQFYNNVVSQNKTFLVGRSPSLKYSSAFENSIISDHETLVGYWSREKGGIIPIPKPNITLKNVEKNFSLQLNENETAAFPKNHLHLQKAAQTKLKGAGIFKK